MSVIGGWALILAISSSLYPSLARAYSRGCRPAWTNFTTASASCATLRVAASAHDTRMSSIRVGRGHPARDNQLGDLIPGAAERLLPRLRAGRQAGLRGPQRVGAGRIVHVVRGKR